MKTSLLSEIPFNERKTEIVPSCYDWYDSQPEPIRNLWSTRTQLHLIPLLMLRPKGRANRSEGRWLCSDSKCVTSMTVNENSQKTYDLRWILGTFCAFVRVTTKFSPIIIIIIIFKILNKHLSIFIYIPSRSFQFFTCILLDAFKSSK